MSSVEGQHPQRRLLSVIVPVYFNEGSLPGLFEVGHGIVR